MSQRNTSISLGPELEQFIAEQMATGHYASVSEVVRAALRELEVHLYRVKLRTRATTRTPEEIFEEGIGVGLLIGRRSERFAVMAGLLRTARHLDTHRTDSTPCELLVEASTRIGVGTHLADTGLLIAERPRDE